MSVSSLSTRVSCWLRKRLPQAPPRTAGRRRRRRRLPCPCASRCGHKHSTLHAAERAAARWARPREAPRARAPSLDAQTEKNKSGRNEEAGLQMQIEVAILNESKLNFVHRCTTKRTCRSKKKVAKGLSIRCESREKTERPFQEHDLEKTSNSGQIHWVLFLQGAECLAWRRAALGALRTATPAVLGPCSGYAASGGMGS